MKRETRLLIGKAINSLLLSIEHFNRPSNRGRTEAVLIFMDHSFEMFLKAAILHKGGSIDDPGTRQTIGFDTCVGRAQSDGHIKFLSEEQAVSLRAINCLRDAAQHHILEISEQQLYLHTQIGFTLFKDIMKLVFNQELNTQLPDRVLPISTVVPTDLITLFENETREIGKLLQPGKRKRAEAYSRLLPLTILDSTINGSNLQPSVSELRKKGKLLGKGTSWEMVFRGVASIQLNAETVGPNLNLRITKTEGLPIRLVQEGTPEASNLAVKRVNELDFYNLGRDNLAKHVGLSGPRTTAVIWSLKLQENSDYFKEIVIGGTKHKRYSQQAIKAIKEALKQKTIEEIWSEYSMAKKKKDPWLG